MLAWLSFVLLSLSSLGLAGEGESSHRVRYELVATQAPVNLSGKKTVDFALLLNGSIPAPTLTFTEGDEAEILVRNQIPGQELSIHWHGLLLPNLMDGVAYVTTPPIPSGGSFTFRFPLRQSGTYWYHSHTGLQEQKGVFGALVVQPKKPRLAVDKEAVLVLSDWSDENPDQILANLRKDGDYYLYKKGTIRSFKGAFEAGKLNSYLHDSWIRMGGMDYSDVGYDAFLINGKRDEQLLMAHPGEKIRLRIINAAASTYFHLALGQGPLQIVAVDGVDVQPFLAKEILIGMAETYDVLFTVPEHKNFEFKATAQDGSGSASAWIGMGEKVFAPVRPQPDLYGGMDHSEHAGHSGGEHSNHAEHQEHAAHQEHAEHQGLATHQEHAEHQGHATHQEHAEHQGHAAHPGHGDHSSAPAEVPAGPVIPLATVDELKALEPTAFPKDSPVHDVTLVLDGDMERYVWYINGKAIHEERNIEIREGEIVRFTLVNQTMMHHPMHLHGHFFRVLTRSGALSPWKHSVDVPPHSTRVIEFKADEPGEWMLHCHNLYHMKTGMARVVRYSDFKPAAEVLEHRQHDPHSHEHIYAKGIVDLASHHAQGLFSLSRTWDQLDLRLETRAPHWGEAEGDLLYRRWQSNFLNLTAGLSAYDQKLYGVIGAAYLLPFMIESQVLFNHKGELRLDLDKKLQWTSLLFSQLDVSFRQHEKTEWEASLMYADDWSWAAGLKLTEQGPGVGVVFSF